MGRDRGREGSHDTEVQLDASTDPDETVVEGSDEDVGPMSLTVSASPGSTHASAFEIHDPQQPRYEIRERIASGSEGHVYVVADRALRRKVAMKVLRKEKAGSARRQARFVAEARHTSNLEHPSIPAIYDIGLNDGGAPYFTMRLVRGRTLRDILSGLRADTAEVVTEWTTHRLVQVLLQITHAVAFAHSKGLLHRDLKPANIAVGEHGDVQVLDWGLAKRVGADDESREGDDLDVDVTFTTEQTQLGALVGTPLYMAPEQAACLQVLDERSDVFALGALLYEILCLHAPHKGTTVREVVAAARHCEIESPALRNPTRRTSPVLVETAMRALSKLPADRQQSAADFARELQGFLEGTRQYAERRGKSKNLLSKALKLLGRSRQASEQAELLEKEAAALSEATPAWASTKEKRALWQAEDLAGLQRVNASHLFGRTMDRVARALALDPEDATARRFMAKVRFERFQQACRDGNEVEEAWFEHLVRLHDNGELAPLLRDVGTLHVTSEPAAAQVTIVKFREKHRHLVAAESTELDATPSMGTDVPSGSHVILLSKAGFADACVPVRIERCGATEVHVELIPADTVPDGYAFIPGGPFPSGRGAERLVVMQPSFLIAREPVRLMDYALWLDHLLTEAPDRVRSHVPFAESHGRLLHAVDGQHVFAEPSPIAERPILFHPDLPVVGISRDSAERYCKWLSLQLGRIARLPTQLEWEKAARGTDARLYPWGNRFDATFCSMSQSTAEDASLRPIGAFPIDESPYGVRDLAGGVSDWCGDDVGAERDWAVCRGGGWHADQFGCALDESERIDRSTKSAGLGFRIALPIAPEDHD